MKRLPLLLPLILGLVACGDRPLSTSAAAPDLRPAIADAAHAYKAGFYWLPPMVEPPSYGGTFDASLSPTVEICELVAGACGTVLATYTTTSGPGGETVRLSVDDELYHVNWHAREFDLSTATLYRVSVRAGVGDVLLGFADLRPVDNRRGTINPDTEEYSALVVGRTLPIKFRIETGVVGLLEVQPVEATAAPGATQQFIATVSDLYGNAMTADVSWSSSDEAVATVDQTGLATAIAAGAATITATSEQITGTATLTVVEGGPMIVTVTAAGNHSCALDAAGRAYCWGEGNLGELGDGAALDRMSPVAVVGDLTFVPLDAGRFHTCGITPTGQAYCWGYNSDAQIGVGTTGGTMCAGAFPCRPTPTAVSGDLTFTSITAGVRNTCGITSAGQAYCWGEGFLGALGNGTQARQSPPVPVSGDLAFASISVGNDAACGVTADGLGYCWGSGSGGKLGNGSTATRLTPVAVGGGLTFASIEVGWMHTCGLTPTGQAYCWGTGTFGVLGNGSTFTMLLPVAVSGGLTFASISPGDQHTCGLTPVGQAYCWGNGVNGQLGIGNPGSDARRLTPVPVTGGLTFVSLSAGTSHTCGVTTEGQTYCWGAGFSGQLGIGSPSSRSTPVLVASLP
jgi:alpha-tubulin suppressor-like RCC1 family protein